MSNRDEVLRVLAPPAVARWLSRRGFLGTLGAGALAVACGTRDDATPATKSGGSASGRLESALNIYSWANYQDPANEKTFTQKFGPKINVDVFDSNEAMIAKLALARGTAGYDVVVPSGSYIPQMVSKGLLHELDKSKIPNFANVEKAFLAQPWDPSNKYSVVKDWSTTGYVYDRKAINDDLKDWVDFFEAATRTGVSGKVSVPASPADVVFMVFWRDGINVRTEKAGDLDHAERVLLTELAPHLRAFDSNPVPALLEGSYVLSHMWNGDARSAVMEDPDRYRWVLGAPKTGLWVTTWAILKDTKHPEAAHAWINFMLEPEVSAREIAFHGYNTAVKGTRELLPKDTKALDMIYFTGEEMSRLMPDELNSAHERIVDIYNKVKAKAGA